MNEAKPANRLHFGDNLRWLRDKNVFPDASVERVYLDPLFNCNANSKVLFKEASDEASPAHYNAEAQSRPRLFF